MSPEEASMNGDYVFLCGDNDAASELLRAVNSADPDLGDLGIGDAGSTGGDETSAG